MSEEINKNDEAIETKLDLTDNKELEDNKEPNAPVITMKGLSGKKIASVVKVVKIKKKLRRARQLIPRLKRKQKLVLLVPPKIC